MTSSPNPINSQEIIDSQEEKNIPPSVKDLKLIISPPNLINPQEIIDSQEEKNIAPSEEKKLPSDLIQNFYQNIDIIDIGLAEYNKSKVNPNMVEELVTLFIKKTNEGKSRDQRRSILDNYLSSHNVTFKEIYGWLINNRINSNFIFFAGYLNFSGIGTTLDINKASNYFHQASSQNHSTAQYYLGIFYEKGIGVEKNEQMGFDYYDKSAKKGQSIVSKYALGTCYEKGIGIEENKQMAFHWYQEAANNGHAIAQHNLGNFYRLGIHDQRDYDMAFRYYNLSAQNEYIPAISLLGYCYLEGIGTIVNKKMALELYLKAANMKDQIAQ